MECLSKVAETAVNSAFLSDNTHYIQISQLFRDNIGKVKDSITLSKEYSEAFTDDSKRIQFVDKFVKWTCVPTELINRLQKDENTSNELRELGNTEFRSGRLQEALRCYNLSITFAPPDSIALSLGYSNRSALFLKIQQWESTQEDIERVKSTLSYPQVFQDIKNKLKLREAKAKEMLSDPNKVKEVPEEGQQLTKNLRTLKDPSDFLIGAESSVEIKYDAVTGRSLIATTDIPTGSLILRDLPYFILPERLLRWETEFCSSCLAPLLGGIPHPISTFPLFCNESCLSKWKMPPHEVLAYLHQTTELRDLLLPLAIALNSSTLTDLQQSNTLNKTESYDPSSFKSTFNLISHKDTWEFTSCNLPNEFKAAFLSHLVNELSPQFKIDAAVLLHLIENLPFNAINLLCPRLKPHTGFHASSFPINLSTDSPQHIQTPFACGVFNLIALCNNSCDPNAVLFKNIRSPEALLLSSRHIRKGEEVNISYKTHWSRMNLKQRQDWLLRQYRFKCECEPCLLGIGGSEDLKDEIPGADEKLLRDLEGIHDQLEEVVELMGRKEWNAAWKECVECVEVLSTRRVHRQWRLKVIAEDLLRQIIVQLTSL